MDNNQFGKSRDRKKRRRIYFQVLLIIAAIVGLVYTTANLPGFSMVIPVQPTPTPKPSRLAQVLGEKANSQQGTVSSAEIIVDDPTIPILLNASVPVQREQGFVSISYVGVGPKEGETVISNVRLQKHLKALHDRGFVTITQQDIYDYYYAGKALPEYPLFLFFEDGRMQSARLAHPMLKQLNYKASMLSYAKNLEERDPLFLSDEELLELEKTGYWEIGTNGYRLSYINVFDRHRNFLGEITPLEYFYLSKYLRREYNHYLMDFIRDEFDTPIESFEQMKTRVQEDYRLMDLVYKNRLGKLPAMYVLMHSNTNQFGTNTTVSVENEKWIREYFDMNFNREMLSVNRADANIFDLTRMQPQSYWSVNHLLMRIYHDIDKLGVLPFEFGNLERAAQWTILQGAAEWDGNTIRVTSLPEGEGRIVLNNSELNQNFSLEVRLDGNKMGKQTIELLSDPLASAYTAIQLEMNRLLVYTSSAGAAAGEPVWELDLNTIDQVTYQTWEENRQEALEQEIEKKLAQTYLPVESKRIAANLMRAKADTSKANYKPYIPEISLIDDGSRLLRMVVNNGYLNIQIDGRDVVNSLRLPAVQGGGIALRSAWLEYGYSQRNLADDVYDADFANLLITGANGEIILDYRGPDEAEKETNQDDALALTAHTAVEQEVKQNFFTPVVNWFKRLLNIR